MRTAVITGCGGFVGHHLAHYLRTTGNYDHITGVDIVPCEYDNGCDEFHLADLRDPSQAPRFINSGDHVYHLAADMGGLGYITDRDAQVMTNNIRISMNVLEAAYLAGAGRLLFTSSAVVYPESLQVNPGAVGLRECDVWPAQPSEGGYGLEKLFTEQACRYYREQRGLETRVVRLHNVFGPEGAWDNGKEKAPAALCRKVAEIKHHFGPGYGNFDIEVWGDGKQTRSFLYIDDAVRGIHKVMMSDHPEPLNVGSDRLVAIGDMVDIIAGIAGVKVSKQYDLTKPQGVRGRNSDNELVTKVTGWEPRVTLEDGLRATYIWLERQYLKQLEVV